MSNFTTEDDKRIRDCQDYGINDLLETDYFVTDRPGSPSARRQTVQRLINKISALGGKQIASSGVANPDNSSGVRGDLYFKVPLDASSLSLYQKGLTTWALIFTIPIGGGSGTVGVPSREVDITVPATGLPFAFFTLDCTGSERPVSVLDSSIDQVLDFTYLSKNLYAEFTQRPEDYILKVIIQGTPADLPEADPPLNGVTSSSPNTFTFTPSEDNTSTD